MLVVWQVEVNPSGRLIAYTPDGGEESAEHPERLRPLQEIQSGKPGSVVVATAVDTGPSPREVRQVVRLVYPITRVVEESTARGRSSGASRCNRRVPLQTFAQLRGGI